jgi:hypothetical protein
MPEADNAAQKDPEFPLPDSWPRFLPTALLGIQQQLPEMAPVAEDHVADGGPVHAPA